MPRNFLINSISFANYSGQSNIQTISYKCLNDRDWSAKTLEGPCYDVFHCSANDFIKNNISLGKLIDNKDTDIVWETIQAALMKRVPYQLMYHIKTPLNEEKIVFELGHGIYVGDRVVELQGFISDMTPAIQLTSTSSKADYFTQLSCQINAILQKTYNNKHFTCNLSIREIEILICICKGMTMKEAGNKLTISSRTVEMHIEKIKEKLQCYTKYQIKELFFQTAIGNKLTSLF